MGVARKMAVASSGGFPYALEGAVSSDASALEGTVRNDAKPHRKGLSPTVRSLREGGAGAAKALVDNVRGQMTIELAVALPALLAVALLAANALTFFGQCAVFDRAAHQAVRVHAAAPAYGQATSTTCALVEADIRQALGDANIDVSVACSAAGRDVERYTATLSFSPSLFGYGLRSQVFGVQMPQLTHTTDYVVDSYKPGVIV